VIALLLYSSYTIKAVIARNGLPQYAGGSDEAIYGMNLCPDNTAFIY
jgi:hypothetical protein